jgi:hypothetical protein
MRHVVILLAALAGALTLAACGDTPRPFAHEQTDAIARPPKQDRTEATIEIPANMPTQMAERVAAAIAIELQSYGVVAALQPARAPIKITGAMSTRDAFGSGIEVEINWFVLGPKGVQGPAISKTVTRPEDFAVASDRLVSRIAQQAAPRIATLMGRPPTFEARSPGQVAAGITMPEVPPEPETKGGKPLGPENVAATPTAKLPKVMVASVQGAPSDGNRQLAGGMRRALGSNRIVVSDAPGGDVYSVTANVALSTMDDRMTQLSITWYLKDPSGKEVGKIDQSNPVPIAATRGTWAGFGDIVATAAVEGILELLEKANSKPR